MTTLDHPQPRSTRRNPPGCPEVHPTPGFHSAPASLPTAAAKARSRRPGRRLLRLHSRPTRPARGPSTPVSSRAIGGALPRMERPASTQNEHVSDWTRAKERAGSSSEAHSRDVAQLDSGPEGPQAPLEAPTQLGRRPEGSGDAKTAAGLLTG